MATKNNNTLLYAGLGLAALLIFKKKSASVGATRYYQFSPIEDKLYKRQMELFEEWERADEENPMNIVENDKYYRDLIFRLEELQDKIYNRRWQKQFGNNVGVINNPASTSIIISGPRRLAADAFFCFEKYTSYKNDKRGKASTLILNYPTESQAREELNKGMQYLISRYPNYKIEEVKYTGNTRVFYVIDPTTNERISIYIY